MGYLGLEKTMCCGILEIDGLSGYRSSVEAMKDFIEESFEPPKGFQDRNGEGPGDNDDYWGGNYKDIHGNFGVVLFTAAGQKSDRGYGERFKALIEKDGLGTVVETAPTKNHNTGRMIKAYLWTPNREAVTSWAKEKKVWVKSQE